MVYKSVDLLSRIIEKEKEKEKKGKRERDYDNYERRFRQLGASTFVE